MPRPRCRPATAIPSIVDAAIVSDRLAPRVNLTVSRAIRVLCAVAMSGIVGITPAAEHNAGANYTLKLEYEMRDRGSMQEAHGQLSPAGLPNINDLVERASEADDLVKALEQDHQQWMAELSDRENVINELEQALESQNETIRLLENKVLQPAPSSILLPQAGTRTWGLSGWDPREIRWDDIRNFTRSPTAAERALTVAVVLLLLHALYLRLRVHKSQPERVRAPVRAGERDTAQRSAIDRSRPQSKSKTRPSPGKREAADRRPVASGPPRHQPPANPNRGSPSQVESGSAPPVPRTESPQPQETAPPTVNLAAEELLQQPPPAGAAPMQQSIQSPSSPSSPPRQRQKADPEILREVDALIAFEQFHEAADLLAKVMVDNPEYRLRSLYIRNALGDYERIANDQSILEAMMDGPMSDTLGRVIKAGRGLLPENPLFESQDTAAAPTPPEPLPSDDPIALSDGDIDEFNESTFSWTDIERDDDQPKTD